MCSGDSEDDSSGKTWKQGKRRGGTLGYVDLERKKEQRWRPEKRKVTMQVEEVREQEEKKEKGDCGVDSEGDV